MKGSWFMAGAMVGKGSKGGLVVGTVVVSGTVFVVGVGTGNDKDVKIVLGIEVSLGWSLMEEK